MKIIQKSSFIIAIIILVSICFIFSANASSLDIYDNFEYTIVNEKNKTCEIDEINVRKCDFLEIPAKMDGYTVVSLRDEVFQDISYPEIKAISNNKCSLRSLIWLFCFSFLLIQIYFKIQPASIF